jgi:hypothetical protein
MQDTLGVRGGESCAQLARDLDGFVAGQTSDTAQEGAGVLQFSTFL